MKVSVVLSQMVVQTGRLSSKVLVAVIIIIAKVTPNVIWKKHKSPVVLNF